MRAISLENKLKYFGMMKGKTQRMLIERVDSRGVSRGYGENYIPIQIQGASLTKNTFINLTLNEIINEENEDKAAFIGIIQ